jgi:hypothetical protein
MLHHKTVEWGSITCFYQADVENHRLTVHKSYFPHLVTPKRRSVKTGTPEPWQKQVMLPGEEHLTSYEIYLYDFPKDSKGGKQPISVSNSQMKEFANVDGARKSATLEKDIELAKISDQTRELGNALKGQQ